MSETDISTAAVERLLDGVTEGPWVCTEADILGERTDVVMGLEYYVASIHCRRAGVDAKANTRFIAASRNLVPALLADRDRLAAEVADHVGKARLLVDTGAALMGETIDFPPSVILKALDHLDAALRVITEGRA